MCHHLYFLGSKRPENVKIGDTIYIRAVCADDEKICNLAISADYVKSLPNLITINGDATIRDLFVVENDALTRVNNVTKTYRAEIILHAKHRYQDCIQIFG